MTFQLFPTSQSVKITMPQVHYDLLAAGVEQDPTMLERLLMSHCQQIQRSQDETTRTKIQQFVETADPEQMAAVLTSMTDLQAAGAAVTKG
jgi:hypothetical protein